MPNFDIGNRFSIYGQKRNTTLEEFYDIMADVWWNAFYAAPKHRNVEQLLFHPVDALQYCNEIRLRTTFAIPDEEILQTLTNLRKNGFLKANEPTTVSGPG